MRVILLIIDIVLKKEKEKHLYIIIADMLDISIQDDLNIDIQTFIQVYHLALLLFEIFMKILI
jgi:hypothetical protein